MKTSLARMTASHMHGVLLAGGTRNAAAGTPGSAQKTIGKAKKKKSKAAKVCGVCAAAFCCPGRRP